jgi:hypothetical protein
MKTMIYTQSILTQKFLEPILITARKNLLSDGYLAQVAFVRDRSGRVIAVLLEMPKDPFEKRAYLAAWGSRLRRAGVVITEAVLLAEGWFVDGRKAPAPLSLPPSQHPARQEAITMVGRNAAGTRTTSVVQVFSRDRDNQPVWGQVAIASYNQLVKPGERMESLLDCLFMEPKGGDQHGTGQTLQSEKELEA